MGSHAEAELGNREVDSAHAVLASGLWGIREHGSECSSMAPKQHHLDLPHLERGAGDSPSPPGSPPPHGQVCGITGHSGCWWGELGLPGRWVLGRQKIRVISWEKSPGSGPAVAWNLHAHVSCLMGAVL